MLIDLPEVNRRPEINEPFINVPDRPICRLVLDPDVLHEISKAHRTSERGKEADKEEAADSQPETVACNDDRHQNEVNYGDRKDELFASISVSQFRHPKR